MNRPTIAALVTSLFFSVSSVPAAQPLEFRGPAGDLAFETSSQMKELFHSARKIAPKDWASRSGASGVNEAWENDHSKPWFIEQQSNGIHYITYGLALKDTDSIRWGLKILNWGFSVMQPDGEFQCHDNYHSTSFFVDAVSHAILLIEASEVKTEFAEVTKAMKPKLKIVAGWMIRPEIHEKAWGKKGSERGYGHRFFLDGAAIGSAGLVLADKAMLDYAAQLVSEGISAQRADGVNTEKGGHDSHYQAYGLAYAWRYYTIVADADMRTKMKPMLDKANAWLLTRIGTDGTVLVDGNTRTGNGQEVGRSGKPKGVEYRFVISSLLEWAATTGNEEPERVARLVYQAGERQKAAAEKP
ncbi:MAG: hypothetical protein WCO60_13510 [Verrucomicrobiota bacterium]